MSILYQSAFLKALGWSLLHSFWQMGLLWLAYVMLTANGKKFNSTQKHSLALLSLAGGALWFLITLIVHFYRLVDTESLAIHATASSVFDSSISSLFLLIEPTLPFISVAYLLSVIYLFIRLYRQYYVTQKLFYTGTYKVRPELRVFLRSISRRMGIKKDVSIWLSNLVDTPLTIGFWKPVILLPVAAMNHLSLQQAEAIILHELNHIRRNDYFINLLIACMDIILFFNPFVRILTHIIKNERENSCDDMVLQFRYDAGQYASALLLLEKNRSSVHTLAINATGRNRKLLLNRVERILNRKSSATAMNQKLVAYLLSAFLIGFIGLYNPGKAIVNTIETVRNETIIGNSEDMRFTTGQVLENKVSTTATSTATKKKAIKVNERPKEYAVQDDSGEDAAEEMIYATSADEANTADHLSSIMSFAGTETEPREFSISESVTPVQAQYSSEIHPYVPSTSFSYHFVEDTALPKKYILTQADVKAKESMNTALKALQEIDWQKVEKELAASGKKVDIIKLQQELQKAMSEVDWKKVNEEIESSLMQAENQLMQDHENLRTELKKFQQNRGAKKLEQQRIYNSIIQERLCEQKKQSTTPNKKATQKKKIVYI